MYFSFNTYLIPEQFCSDEDAFIFQVYVISPPRKDGGSLD